MIRKFLVIGNFVSMASSRPEEDQTSVYIVDILMPIDTHWEIIQLIEKANFLIATGQQFIDVQDLYKKVFIKAAPFALYENDRGWLYQKSQGKK